MVLQIDTFGCRIGCQQDAHRSRGGIGLEGGLDRLAFQVIHAAVEHEQTFLVIRPLLRKALACQQAIEPVLSGTILGKDNDALLTPTSTWFERFMQPGDQFLCFAIGAMAGLFCLSPRT